MRYLNLRHGASLAALVTAFSTNPALADTPRIVADMPVAHSLVSMVLGDLGRAELLLERGADPHSFQLRPSQARAVAQADLVVWMGEDLTPWMARAVSSLASGAVMELLDAEGIALQPYAEARLTGAAAEHGRSHAHGHDDHGHDHDDADDHGHDDHGHEHDEHGHDEHGHDAHGHDHGNDDHGHGHADAHGDHGHGHDHGHDHGHEHEEHGHGDHEHGDHGHGDHAHGHDDGHDHGHEPEHEGHDHGHAHGHAHGHGDHGDHHHGDFDPHAWMNPHNVEIWVQAIGARLAALDPAHAETYTANAAAAVERIEALESELEAMLAPLGDAGLVMYHDAYGYLASAFGLNVLGTVALGDAVDPGAARLSAIRASLEQSGAVCIFPEVNHPDAYIALVSEGASVRVGAPLDPEGVMLEPGAMLYETLMRSMAQAIVDCVTEG